MSRIWNFYDWCGAVHLENQQPFWTDLRKHVESFMQNLSAGSSIWRVSSCENTETSQTQTFEYHIVITYGGEGEKCVCVGGHIKQIKAFHWISFRASFFKHTTHFCIKCNNFRDQNKPCKWLVGGSFWSAHQNIRSFAACSLSKKNKKKKQEEIYAWLSNDSEVSSWCAHSLTSPCSSGSVSSSGTQKDFFYLCAPGTMPHLPRELSDMCSDCQQVHVQLLRPRFFFFFL